MEGAFDARLIAACCGGLEEAGAGLEERLAEARRSGAEALERIEAFRGDLARYQKEIKEVKGRALELSDAASDERRAALSPALGLIRNYELALQELGGHLSELSAEARGEAGVPEELGALRARLAKVALAKAGALEAHVPSSWENLVSPSLWSALQSETDRVLSLRAAYRSIHEDFLSMRTQFLQLAEIDEKMKRDRADSGASLEEVRAYYEPRSKELTAFLKTLRERLEELRRRPNYIAVAGDSVDLVASAPASASGAASAASPAAPAEGETKKSRDLVAENEELRVKVMRAQRSLLRFLSGHYQGAELSAAEEGDAELEERFGDEALAKLMEKSQLKSQIIGLDRDIQYLRDNYQFPKAMLQGHTTHFTEADLTSELSQCEQELVFQVAVDAEILKRLRVSAASSGKRS